MTVVEINPYCFYLLQEAHETGHKTLKYFQLHHAPQSNLTARNSAAFWRMIDVSSPEILRHFSRLSKQKLRRSKKPYPREVLELCKDMNDFQSSDVTGEFKFQVFE